MEASPAPAVSWDEIPEETFKKLIRREEERARLYDASPKLDDWIEALGKDSVIGTPDDWAVTITHPGKTRFENERRNMIALSLYREKIEESIRQSEYKDAVSEKIAFRHALTGEVSHAPPEQEDRVAAKKVFRPVVRWGTRVQRTYYE